LWTIDTRQAESRAASAVLESQPLDNHQASHTHNTQSICASGSANQQSHITPLLRRDMSNSIFATRTLVSVANRAGRIQRSFFHSTAPVTVRVGDVIPDTDVLVENSPGNKINLAKEIKGKRALIIGVPAAFSKYKVTHRACCQESAHTGA
jgi:hypothetical protein